MLAVRSGRRVTVGNRSEIVTKYQVNDGVDSWLGIYAIGRKLGGPIYLRGSVGYRLICALDQLCSD